MLAPPASNWEAVSWNPVHNARARTVWSWESFRAKFGMICKLFPPFVTLSAIKFGNKLENSLFHSSQKRQILPLQSAIYKHLHPTCWLHHYKFRIFSLLFQFEDVYFIWNVASKATLRDFIPPLNMIISTYIVSLNFFIQQIDKDTFNTMHEGTQESA